MSPHKAIILSLILTGCATAEIAAKVDCGDLAPCISNAQIAVIAKPDIADPILSSAQEGAAAFTRYFGAKVSSVAIVPGGVITKDMSAKLKRNGFDRSLPWISAADKQVLAAQSVRRQVQEQTKGLPPEQQAAIMKMALAKVSGGDNPASPNMSATEEGALTHELGHLWFIAAFQPRADQPRTDKGSKGHGYGGWAPDWLDETAAVLLENAALTETRRAAFAKIAKADLYPLPKFLTMEHPALKSAQSLKEKMGGKLGQGESRAIVLSGKEAEAFLEASKAGDPGVFYTQVRGFADFIISETGDERIFAKLARELASGGSLETWLAASGGLPSTLTALEANWDERLKAR